jgi:hydrogenase expression/formation protein HypC
MQVLALEPGHATCAGRGQERRINTALVGDVQVDDWVLVFIDSAQEIITPQRAAEVNATLDLVEAAVRGEHQDMALGFALPSAMSQTDMAALCGVPSTLETP